MRVVPRQFVEKDLPSLPLPERAQLILSAVCPRPIALTGTVNGKGEPNLAPFSFFNVFGSNPVFVGISPALAGRDATPKHTYLNILETKEFTVSIVSYEMVEQASLASSNYPAGVDEFVKAGFTPKTSSKIRPPGVSESPCVLECRLHQYVPLGGQAGSGNLLIGEVVNLAIAQDVFDADGKIDPFRIDAVSRLGYEWYSRARNGLFQLPKPPLKEFGVGFDRLPKGIRESEVLTGNELARLAGVSEIPGASGSLRQNLEVIWTSASANGVHLFIRERLSKGELGPAWEAVHFLSDKGAV